LNLRDLNIIFGANGSGKSNLVQVFRLLMAMSGKEMQKFVLENGGADNFLYNGPKNTLAILMEFEFEFGSYVRFNMIVNQRSNSYRFELISTVDDTFVVSEEWKYTTTTWRSYGSPSQESRLEDERQETSASGKGRGVGYYVYRSIANWMVYHFHDTSSTAPMRRSEIIEDNAKLRSNGGNKLLFRQKKIVGISFIIEIGIQIGIGIDLDLNRGLYNSPGIVVYCDNRMIIKQIMKDSVFCFHIKIDFDTDTDFDLDKSMTP
jgi:predicted ATPase